MSMNCNPFTREYSQCEIQSGFTKNLVFKDARAISELRVINPNQKFIIKLQVDGCLINDTARRCDFLLLVCNAPEKSVAYFIELKGGNLTDAIEQIQLTIERLSNQLKTFDFRCRIVQTRTPPTQVINQKKEVLLHFLKKAKFAPNVRDVKVTELVQIKNTPYTETI